MELGTNELGTVLRRAAAGDRQAAKELLPLVYGDLKGLAHARLARVQKGHTIQTTDLVHESWLRLVENGDPGWEGRRHFFGAAARAMRNILVEEARRRTSVKRDASRKRELPTGMPEIATDPPVEDVLSVGEALDKFEKDHPRAAEIVWLRFFDGLSMPEVAELTGISLATAERDWRFARAWLQEELGRDNFAA